MYRIHVVLFLLVIIIIFNTTSAYAAHVTAINLNGNKLTDYSQANLIEFDIEWNTAEPVSLLVKLDDQDKMPKIAFSSSSMNSTGLLWSGFHAEIVDDALWSENWLVDVFPGMYSKRSVDSKNVDIEFKPSIPSPGILNLGKPNNTIDSNVDWQIDISNLGPSRSFAMKLKPKLSAH